MFGYIKVYKPELKFKEYEVYKGIYCSLCKQLGKNYGVFSRLILNYDFTFLSLLFMAINEKESEFEKSHCTFCFNKKCMCCKATDKTLEYTSALTIITSYHKIQDDLSDGNILKKIRSALLLPYFKSKYKKAYSKFPIIAKIIDEEMKNQSKTEDNNSSSIDMAADASAKAMGKIISSAFDGSKEVLYRFGYCLGRFVYISDALDDLEKDYKSKNYNTLLVNNNNPNFADIRNNSLSLLNTTADELAKAYELIRFNRYKPILDNIIYYGLDLTIDKVLRKEAIQNEKSV